MKKQMKIRLSALKNRMVFRLWAFMMIPVMFGIGFMWVVQILSLIHILHSAQVALGLGQIDLGGIHVVPCGFYLLGVDLHQHLSLADHVTGLDIHGSHIAAGLGVHIHLSLIHIFGRIRVAPASIRAFRSGISMRYWLTVST